MGRGGGGGRRGRKAWPATSASGLPPGRPQELYENVRLPCLGVAWAWGRVVMVVSILSGYTTLAERRCVPPSHHCAPRHTPPVGVTQAMPRTFAFWCTKSVGRGHASLARPLVVRGRRGRVLCGAPPPKKSRADGPRPITGLQGTRSPIRFLASPGLQAEAMRISHGLPYSSSRLGWCGRAWPPHGEDLDPPHHLFSEGCPLHPASNLQPHHSTHPKTCLPTVRVGQLSHKGPTMGLGDFEVIQGLGKGAFARVDKVRQWWGMGYGRGGGKGHQVAPGTTPWRPTHAYPYHTKPGQAQGGRQDLCAQTRRHLRDPGQGRSLDSRTRPPRPTHPPTHYPSMHM